jgi:hypothetical protein
MKDVPSAPQIPNRVGDVRASGTLIPCLSSESPKVLPRIKDFVQQLFSMISNSTYSRWNRIRLSLMVMTYRWAQAPSLCQICYPKLPPPLLYGAVFSFTTTHERTSWTRRPHYWRREYQTLQPAIFAANYPPWLSYDGSSDPRFSNPQETFWLEPWWELRDFYLQVSVESTVRVILPLFDYVA